MKSLLDCINENLESVNEAINLDSVQAWVSKYVGMDPDGYKIVGKSINVPRTRIPVIAKDAESITNGEFKWGRISGNFNVTSALITDLTGCPKTVKDAFIVSGCDSLVSLKGAPKAYDVHITECPKLKTLKFISVDKDGRVTVEKCDKLVDMSGLEDAHITSLSVVDCKKLESVSQVGYVRSLRINNCPNLTDISGLANENLTFLEVDEESPLVDDLRKIVKKCPKMYEVQVGYSTVYKEGKWMK